MNEQWFCEDMILHLLSSRGGRWTARDVYLYLAPHIRSKKSAKAALELLHKRGQIVKKEDGYELA